MTSHGSIPLDPQGVAARAAASDGAGADGSLSAVDALEPSDSATEANASPAAPGAAGRDGHIVEELTNRLPPSELVKIIKNALECGRRNVPFTESELLRAMAFGASFAPERAGAPARRR